MKKILSFLILCMIIVVGCKQETKSAHTDTAATSEKLGSINFVPTGKKEALPLFEKGLLLLHNFEYKDARKTFKEAQDVDPEMVMAYWGEVMTYNQPLWRVQKHEEGKLTLAKIAATPEERQAKATTALEKDLLAAVEILFRDEGEKKERDKQYNAFMEKLYKKYPGNNEVASFYALSCLGAVKLGRDVAAYEKGADIAKGVLANNPNHPGALHYLIHSYDDPEHAPLALTAANRYSKVAAAAPHALHMPSHIYVAVGMWDEVVSSNIASWEAGQKRVEEKALEDDQRAYHAYHWLMYGRLQKGQLEEAKKMMTFIKQYIDDESLKKTRSYLISMKGNYLMESGDWDSEIVDYNTDVEDLNIRVRSIANFLKGMQAYRAKDMQALENVIKEMAKDRGFAETMIDEEGQAMCGSGGSDRFKSNRTDVNRARTMEMELRALKVWKDKNAAEAWLQKAVALEEDTNYAFGPPVIVQPTHELYGKWLLENNRLEDAAVQYEKALERGPKRLLPMRALAEVYKKTGAKEKLEKLENDLKFVLKDADDNLEEKMISLL